MTMDPEYSLQDAVRCHLCETPMPLFHCDICDKNMCKDCEEQHLSDGSTKHKVVPYQMRSRSNSDQEADLNKNSQKIRTTMKKYGEDWHRNTLPSAVKQKNKKQTNRQYGSLSALSEEHGDTIDLLDVESPPIHTLLIDEPRIISTINTEFGGSKNGLHMVSCGSNGEDIWTCGYDNILRLYNPRGKFLRSVQTKTGNIPEDIVVTKTGDLVYIDESDSTVNIVKGTKIQPLVILQGLTPRSVCSTSTGDLLVIMDGGCYSYANVMRYSGSTEKQRFPYSFGHSMKYITENRNLDICVADCGVCAVVVFNQAGEFRFTYTVPPCITKLPFTPYGITTDSQSRILTADFKNNCIHILDQDGQFLRYIKDRHLHAPWGLCVDTNDTLFVAENDGKVKRIQYSKKKTENIGVRFARFLGIIN